MVIDEKGVFVAALALPDTSAREAYLQAACDGDPELLGRMRELLAAHDESQGPLDRRPPALGVTVDTTPAEEPGTVIGPYKLLEQIGEGGMGTVWMAQQTEPVKRLVAVKLIKAGMDSKQVIARFEAERQALALMDHPNIARVLDAGTTDAGRPYFVMDLVKGVPITKYCDEHHLTPRQRLELFIPVCQAVQHAHQKGIIHRDLKPSNVLVALYDGKPVPKVIDFGVAKAAGQPLTDKTLVTGFGNIVGTLEYMSPEQAEINQLDIDTRSDIYSLGVLLYELLTGSPPFSTQGAGKGRHAGDAAGDPRGGAVEAEHEAEHGGGLADAGRQPRHGAGEADEAGARRAGLDRDEGAGEGPQPPLRDGQRLRRWTCSATWPTSRCRRVRRRRGIGCGSSPGGTRAAWRWPRWCCSSWCCWAAASAGWCATRRCGERSWPGQVELILGEVEQLEAEQKWPEALAAARRAEALVAGSGGDVALEGQVQRVLADLNLVQRLEEIRLERVAEMESKIRGWADRAYAAAFRDAGMDVDQLTEEEAVKRLGSRTHMAVALAAALDDWAFRRHANQNTDGADMLRAVALRIDPHPWRQQVRQALARQDGKTLERLAASPDVLGQPPATLFQLGRAFRTLDLKDQGIALLRQAQRLHAGDFHINFELARLLATMGPDHQDDALAFYRTAAALRPHSAAVWARVGSVLSAKGAPDEACACLRGPSNLTRNTPAPTTNSASSWSSRTSWTMPSLAFPGQSNSTQDTSTPTITSAWP